jgi:hypothetical protein
MRYQVEVGSKVTFKIVEKRFHYLNLQIIRRFKSTS